MLACFYGMWTIACAYPATSVGSLNIELCDNLTSKNRIPLGGSRTLVARLICPPKLSHTLLRIHHMRRPTHILEVGSEFCIFHHISLKQYNDPTLAVKHKINCHFRVMFLSRIPHLYTIHNHSYLHCIAPATRPRSPWWADTDASRKGDRLARTRSPCGSHTAESSHEQDPPDITLRPWVSLEGCYLVWCHGTQIELSQLRINQV